jgi:hypothetical protein
MAASVMACATLAAKEPATLNLAGSKHFDSDSIASAGQPEHRWLSYPGARLCVNPANREFVVADTSTNLELDLGGYLGTTVVRLSDVVRVGLVDASQPESEPEWAASASTKWFPYQLAFTSHFTAGASVTGADTFINREGTLIRTLTVKDGWDKSLYLCGQPDQSCRVAWDEDNQALLVIGTNYFYALRFMQLTGRALKPVEIDAQPMFNGNHWRLEFPLNYGTAHYGISFGFATRSEGQHVSVERAVRAFQQPVKDSLENVKSGMDQFLAKVPAPKQWNLQTVNPYGVTPEKCRQAYYMAWTFLYQSTLDRLPENPAFPYPQMSLGKGALWDGGERTSIATCGWESFLGLQWFSFVDPDFAWQAYEGILSRVDAQGRLGGESLPSRKAQTAWMLYQRKPDQQRLAAVYPALKRYLLWREQNPRWIWSGGHDMSDEKDLEFVVSWLFDIEYAARIADALGRPDESAFWRAKAPPMIDEMNCWFFSDPKELHQYFFTNSATFATQKRNEVRPIMILTALGLPGLPPSMQERLQRLFAAQHKPDAAADGFNYLKYPDNDFVAYGLIEHHNLQAREYLEAVLRDLIRGGEFAETLENGDGQNPVTGGVKPSLFDAMNIIEFTWLLNGIRYDSGTPEPCALPGQPLPQK